MDRFDRPDPSKYLDIEESSRRTASAPPDKVKLGVLWSAHFQDACSAFGMETALVKALTNSDMFRAVINRIIEFYLQANEIFYEATKYNLDCILIDQAKSYGLDVIHHSCGSIFPIIEDLVSTLDITATILDYAGVEKPAAMQSNSLAPLVMDGDVEWRDHLFLESLFTLRDNPFCEGLRKEQWKYIRMYDVEKPYMESDIDFEGCIPDFEQLFNLEDDPG